MEFTIARDESYSGWMRKPWKWWAKKMITFILIVWGLPGTLDNWATWTQWWGHTIWPVISAALYASPKLLSPAMLLVGLGLLLADIAPFARRAPRKAPAEAPPAEGHASALPPRPASTSPAQRVFTDKRPRDLVDVCTETTSSRAEQLISKYMHKWMLIEGTVHDAGRCSILCRNRDNTDAPLIAPVSLQFDPSWEDHLSRLQRGDAIRAIGRLTEVTPIGISLDQCELLPSASEGQAEPEAAISGDLMDNFEKLLAAAYQNGANYLHDARLTTEIHTSLHGLSEAFHPNESRIFDAEIRELMRQAVNSFSQFARTLGQSWQSTEPVRRDLREAATEDWSTFREARDELIEKFRCIRLRR